MLKKLHDAYMGELFGIVFFTAFKERSTDLLEQEKWRQLIEVEQRTAELLKGYLEPLGMRCSTSDAAMTKQGLAQAQAWIDLAWEPLMGALAPWIREYAEVYRRSADDATEHRDLWNMVADHEEALLAFVEGERDGMGDSLKPVRGFLKRYA
ncbi:hypothetical protein DSLASN_24360 [Desulfoluna limicola]|uniref:Uncharacterized protein n=1 Tax=Desulfoluna limicola TaxID=2810562 RepID=A0ABM7PIA1_9BACT|nr:hypothetical protein [Desulfoluna limicola]BCS96804.1 hypothetical protein DSLASN_24360 [Desulfoluna limicola]